MAFVVARRGQKFIKVSKQSYENIFKNKGYRIVEEEKQKLKSEVKNEEQVTEEHTENDELETTPISEMNREQLMEFAEKHNIDMSGVKNVGEARRRIQKAVREERM